VAARGFRYVRAVSHHHDRELTQSGGHRSRRASGAQNALLNGAGNKAVAELARKPKVQTSEKEVKALLDLFNRYMQEEIAQDSSGIRDQVRRIHNVLEEIQIKAAPYEAKHTGFFGKDAKATQFKHLPAEAKMAQKVLIHRSKVWSEKKATGAKRPKWIEVMPHDMNTQVLDLDKAGAKKKGKAKGGLNEVTKFETKSAGTGFFKKDKASLDHYWDMNDPKNKPVVGADFRDKQTFDEYALTRDFGMSPEDPHFARKATASARIDKLLGTHVLADTHMATKTVGGKKVFGSFQQAADGKELAEATKVLNKHKEADGGAGKLSMADQKLMRELSKLTMVDALCGQIDRHFGNVFVAQNAKGNATQIKGIDHDLSFPTKNFDLTKITNKYKGLGKHMDAEAAEMLMALEPSVLRGVVEDLLTDEEIKALLERLEALKKAVKQMKLVDAKGWDRGKADAEAKHGMGYLGEERAFMASQKK
jgi:hypothetical protein